MSDKETEGQSGHLQTNRDCENLSGECPRLQSKPDPGVPRPRLGTSGSWAPGRPHPSIKPPAADRDEVTAPITWRGPMGFRAASLPSLINGHFNGKNKNCIFYTLAIIFQHTHLSLK